MCRHAVAAATAPQPLHCILPPYILHAIAQNGSEAQRADALVALGVDRAIRDLREAAAAALRLVSPPFIPLPPEPEPEPEPEARPAPGAAPTGGTPQPLPPRRSGPRPRRTIFDATNVQQLPGRVVRREGAGPLGDPAVDEAYEGLGATFEFYLRACRRHSIDNHGMPLDATVHFGLRYDNAFWDGRQMVFGDGDGQLFNRFTVALDVIGHELAHGVTAREAGLMYQDQSGALNESMSDVFGAMIKQHALGQDVAAADWLIGAGLLAPGVNGVALRSMKAPGTAFDDRILGRDPQPAHMRDFIRTADDNGGVHLNSGIPNHAFYLAATAIGGKAWEGAGKVWYEVLTDPRLRPDADFKAFARLTTRTAQKMFGPASREATAVARAWTTVGVN